MSRMHLLSGIVLSGLVSGCALIGEPPSHPANGTAMRVCGPSTAQLELSQMRAPQDVPPGSAEQLRPPPTQSARYLGGGIYCADRHADVTSSRMPVP